MAKILRSQRRRRQWGALPDSKLLLAQLIGQKFTKLGFELICSDPMPKVVQRVGSRKLEWSGLWQVKGAPTGDWFKTQRGAIKHWLLQHPRKYGTYYLTRGWSQQEERATGRWLLRKHESHGERTIAEWVVRPTRAALAKILRAERRRDPKPSHARPDTLGWRGWVWDTRNSCLKSPSQGTLWDNGPELRVTDWNEGTGVRNHAGIHACRLPRGDWRQSATPRDFIGSDVVGLVERFGKFVLGTEGWRAEWVIIKELLVCDEVTAAHVRHAYPEVPVGVAPKGHWLRRGDY